MADLDRLTEVIEPEAKALGFELVRVKMMPSEAGDGGEALQIMAEDPATGQLVIEQCAALSRRVSDRIDALEEDGEVLIDGAYHLEVSSPGIDRPLTRAKDFANWAGHETKISMAKSYDGQRNLRGELKGIDGDIVTIEDPVEYVHRHKKSIINQREVGVDTRSFHAALKNTLRQAPDVILIGEIRDRETMEHALAFADTGHLAISTLHANNANQALDRIIHFFPTEMHQQVWMDLSLNLKAIVAQQLIPTPDGKGRRAAIEVLLNTPLAADMIRKGEVHELKPLMARSNELGMQTFDQALYKLYSAGEITYEDALLHADSANDLRLMIKLGSETDGQHLMQDQLSHGLSLEEEEEVASRTRRF